MRIELHIEELVLEGLPSRDRDRIGMAVETALARLLEERGLPPALALGESAADISAGDIDIQPGATPESIGEQIALVLYEGLST
jgi:hypothetical protein